MEDHYAVECSRIDSGMYLVNGTCTCVDAQQRTDLHHGWCKHKLAVEIYKEQQAIAENPQVANAINKASTSSLESERTLEDRLSDLYPKARPTNSPR
jgi:hypothetical protein